MGKQSQGRAAKRHGKDFEAMIEQWLAVQPKAWTDIRKQNEALKPVRPSGKGQFIAVYTKPSGCDYFGTVMGGYSVVMEAKHRESDRIAQSDLTEAETEHLNATSALGGYALLIVRFSDGKVFLLPYPLLRNSQLVYKHKHIKERELMEGGYEVDFNESLYGQITKQTRKALTLLVELRNREIENGVQ